jgi:carbon storage regulator CsrA
MGGLVLTRKSGQCVRLEMSPGVYCTLLLAYTGSNQVKLDLMDREGAVCKRVDVGAEMVIGPGVTVKVLSITFKTVKLLFEAPLSVKIMRTELLERA